MEKYYCAKCKLALKPAKNGVLLIDTVASRPYAAAYTDLWACPECGVGVYAGQGKVMESSETRFEQVVKYEVCFGNAVAVYFNSLNKAHAYAKANP